MKRLTFRRLFENDITVDKPGFHGQIEGRVAILLDKRPFLGVEYCRSFDGKQGFTNVGPINKRFGGYLPDDIDAVGYRLAGGPLRSVLPRFDANTLRLMMRKFTYNARNWPQDAPTMAWLFKHVGLLKREAV